MEQQFNRFKDAIWFNQEIPEVVFVGGAGGIGSWLTFLLSRAGMKAVLFDFDKIEEHNIGGQLFKENHIGMYKVTAVSNIVSEFCGSTISTFAAKVDENTTSHYFMFSAFDNMQARKDLFTVWKKSHEICPVTPIFIDGRLLAEQLQIFCVTPENMEEYEKEHLFDDSEVEDAPCTFRQTSHSAAMIASLMVAFFTNHITNIYEREVIRNVPFYYEYFIPLNITETT